MRPQPTREIDSVFFRLYGRVIEFRGAAELLRDEIWEYLAAWPRVTEAAGTPDVSLSVAHVDPATSPDSPLHGWRYVLRREDRIVALSLDAASLMLQFQGWLDAEILRQVHPLVPVHAGVVAYRGRAIVLPAVSGSGKTTLVGALIAAGAEYLSDEFALIDERGWVHPYPRPLLVRDDRQEQQPVPPSRFQATVRQAAVPVGLVLFLKYAAVEALAIQPLPSSATGIYLQRHLLVPLPAPMPRVPAVLKAADGAKGFEGVRGEAADAAAEIFALAAREFDAS